MSIKVKELVKGHAPKRKTAGSAAYDCQCVTDLSRLRAFDVSYPDAKEAKPHLFAEAYGVKGSDTTITLYPQWRILIPLGFSLEFQPHLVAKLFLRSSIGLKTSLFIPNSVGVIDSDYRGEVGLILGTQFATTLNLKDRLCQLTFEHLYFNEKGEELEIVEALSDTDRGQGGFGSTGKE